ncbi:Y-family DNA polymerase [Methylibium petroleiphilum]|nr:DNA polymerase Y family protein [Methylibium petroleiphilum]
MYWAALLLDKPSDAASLHDDLQGLATWALQWTPRVAIVDEAVVMEVEASLRLFGGKRALRERIRTEGAELGVAVASWASTSLAALAFARAGVENGFARPLTEGLDRLPLEVLSASGPHRPTLARLGCKTLGDVRKLPRGGVSRRFDKELLTALDQAYGLRPEAHAWVELPEQFRARLELMSRVELAAAMMFGVRRLILQMCGWLAARHSGAGGFVLRWAHDAMRSKSAGEGGQLTIRTGEPTRSAEHFSRLLNEHLAKTELLAPVGDLELEAVDVQALEETSGSLLPDTVRQGETLREVLERISARLGPERVLRPVVTEDHRLEWAQCWQPAAEKLPRESSCLDVPQPSWVLPEPLKLATRGPKPMYQGELHLLAGPHRVEGGWWHRVQTPSGQDNRHVQRDYWVALSESAGVLWVFQERLADEDAAWYLHGIFA